MRRTSTAKVAAAAGRRVAVLWILTVLVAVAPTVAEDPVAPEDVDRIHPWRASLPPSLPVLGAPETPPPPAGYFFGPERMAELKRQARVRPDQPPGRIVPIHPGPDAGPAAVPSPRAPGVRTFFNGLNYMTSGYEGHHARVPDTIIAASESRVLEATNYALRLEA